MVNDNYLDRDFYEIYEENGEKYIHIFGYFYEADGSVTDNPDETYRRVEYSWFVVPLKEFILRESGNYTFDDDQVKQYIGDLTEEKTDYELTEYMRNRLEVPYENLTMDIPCGEYYT